MDLKNQNQPVSRSVKLRSIFSLLILGLLITGLSMAFGHLSAKILGRSIATEAGIEALEPMTYVITALILMAFLLWTYLKEIKALWLRAFPRAK